MILAEKSYALVKEEDVIFIVREYVNGFLNFPSNYNINQMRERLKNIPLLLSREHVALWYPKWTGAYWLYNSPNDYSNTLKQIYSK